MSNMVLYNANNLDTLKTLADNSIDAIVTDPPYGISFMNKKWDYDVPSVELWTECLRVLKPGGHLLAFAGTRTQHRMAVNIEDAGFEIRDMIAWIYGSGMPKSFNIGKSMAKQNELNASQWEGYGSTLKPALEPITIARKPIDGTVIDNCLKWGTGGLNIDASRVPNFDTSKERTGEASQDKRYTNSGSTNFAAKPGIRGGDPKGRWPANIIHDRSEEVTELFPHTISGKPGIRRQQHQTNCMSGRLALTNEQETGYGDSGSAARFFYCAKASAAERGSNNDHPTVKPLALMEYLCRLVARANNIILDPFMGSGTTGIACKNLGLNFIGIELDKHYFQIAQERIGNIATNQTIISGEDLDMFD